MNSTKEQIKVWLRQHGKDRVWLGEQLGVDRRTVDNWLSSPKIIPELKVSLIRRLFAEEEKAEAQRQQQLDPTAQVFSIETDLPTFRLLSQAALNSGQILEDWSLEQLIQAANDWQTGRLRLDQISILNEDPAAYITHGSQSEDHTSDGSPKPSETQRNPAKPSETQRNRGNFSDSCTPHKKKSLPNK